jgi:hypothetical protein
VEKFTRSSEDLERLSKPIGCVYPKPIPTFALIHLSSCPTIFEILVLTQNHPSHRSAVGAGLADTSTVSANPIPTKPALPYSDTSAITTDSKITNPDPSYSSDSETIQPIQTHQSQHSGGGRAGLSHTFINGSHAILAKPAPTSTFTHQGISEIIRGFKTFSARRINEKRRTQGCPVWQHNYYEHIIRNDLSLQAIRTYIRNNPQSWQIDQLHPNNPSKW